MRLLANGHEVAAVTRSREKLEQFDWSHAVEVLVGDVHNLDSRILDALTRADVMAHLAWEGLDDYFSSSHLDKTLVGEIGLFRKLLGARGIRRILVTGTCLEYGLQSGCLSEDLPTVPSTPYGAAKDSLRKYLLFTAPQNGCAVQWTRLFYSFGSGQSPSSLLSRLDRAISNGQTTFEMTKGEQLRDYLPVELLAQYVVRILERPQRTGVVNICSGKPISVRRLAEKHVAKMESSIHLEFGRVPYPAHEPMAFWGDARRLEQWCGDE